MKTVIIVYFSQSEYLISLYLYLYIASRTQTLALHICISYMTPGKEKVIWGFSLPGMSDIQIVKCKGCMKYSETPLWH